MQHALGSALSSLPGETLVYCGHEYSLQVGGKHFAEIKLVIFAVRCFYSRVMKFTFAIARIIIQCT